MERKSGQAKKEIREGKREEIQVPDACRDTGG